MFVIHYKCYSKPKNPIMVNNEVEIEVKKRNLGYL